MRMDNSAPFWHRLWSVRFALIAALISLAGEVLPLWQPALSPVPYATLSTLFAVLAAVSRVVHQGDVQSDLNASRSGQ